MAQQIINIGSAPNDGTGDPLRNAFVKVNENFNDLYLKEPLSTRTVVSGTSSILSDGSSDNVSIVAFKSYALLSIETSSAAWVRLYTNEAARTADFSRSQQTDPLPDAGVIAEVITNGAETVKISPAILGYNDETTPSTLIPITITNLSGTSNAVTVSLKILKLEA